MEDVDGHDPEEERDQLPVVLIPRTKVFDELQEANAKNEGIYDSAYKIIIKSSWPSLKILAIRGRRTHR